LLGFALSIAISIPLAVAVVHSAILRNTIYPILLAFQSVPKVAIAPLLALWIGFGMLPKVAVVFLVCFFPIIVATATGLSAVPAPLMELIRSLSASTMQAFIKIRFPTAMPYMFVGHKVAITFAVIGAVIGEFRRVGGRPRLSHSGVDLAVAHAAGICGARVVDRNQHRALLRHRVHRADRRTMGAEELKSLASSVMERRMSAAWRDPSAPGRPRRYYKQLGHDVSFTRGSGSVDAGCLCWRAAIMGFRFKCYGGLCSYEHVIPASLLHPNHTDTRYDGSLARIAP
jgi:Binding-protein-dependent transport system inner membrane component